MDKMFNGKLENDVRLNITGETVNRLIDEVLFQVSEEDSILDCNCISIVGRTGMGKTSLVCKIVEILKSTYKFSEVEESKKGEAAVYSDGKRKIAVFESPFAKIEDSYIDVVMSNKYNAIVCILSNSSMYIMYKQIVSILRNKFPNFAGVERLAEYIMGYVVRVDKNQFDESIIYWVSDPRCRVAESGK